MQWQPTPARGKPPRWYHDNRSALWHLFYFGPGTVRVACGDMESIMINPDTSRAFDNPKCFRCLVEERANEASLDGNA